MPHSRGGTPPLLLWPAVYGSPGSLRRRVFRLLDGAQRTRDRACPNLLFSLLARRSLGPGSRSVWCENGGGGCGNSCRSALARSLVLHRNLWGLSRGVVPGNLRALSDGPTVEFITGCARHSAPIRGTRVVQRTRNLDQPAVRYDPCCGMDCSSSLRNKVSIRPGYHRPRHSMPCADAGVRLPPTPDHTSRGGFRHDDRMEL